MSKFGAQCANLPDVIELKAHILEREPESFAIYLPSEHKTEIYTRVARDGFQRDTYKIIKNKMDVTTQVVNLRTILQHYNNSKDPILDMVSQYEIYRMRECDTRQAYPGELFLSIHEALFHTLDIPDKELYLGALLVVDPRDLFVKKNISQSQRKILINRLEKDLTNLYTHLTEDLDPRVGWSETIPPE